MAGSNASQPCHKAFLFTGKPSPNEPENAYWKSLTRADSVAFLQRAKTWRSSSQPDPEPPPPPLRLTIGIELEFILAECTHPEPATIRNRSNSTARRTVENALKQPMQVVCNTCGETYDFKLTIDSQDPLDYNSWTVEEDGSVGLTDEELYALGENSKYFHFYSIKGKSRILYLQHSASKHWNRSTAHAHDISYMQEIEAVLSKIHSLSGLRMPPTNEINVFVNQTCGFHIHVGN